MKKAHYIAETGFFSYINVFEQNISKMQYTISFEEWKDIPGYESRYQASTLGNFRALDRIIYEKPSERYPNGRVRHTKGKAIQANYIGGNGYIQVQLGKGNENVHLAHRLIAITFIPNPGNKPQINHINGDKTNNYVGNLEWSTRSENQRHRYDVLGHIGSAAKPCVGVDSDGNKYKFPSALAAAKHFGVTGGSIQIACNRSGRSQGGSCGLKWDWL